mmetsp:Transcript_22656/g.31052  ORF Transcript_22656/g.31052 Transcript_22656/m.31052 type:complete len:202 (-) Transcript_22656:103-708(-)|eukprot:CAMPEP_0170075638 /NCGR_PEP_ID=MMETSP0019_2-20121128/12746_1 /TAXON_ID=98059 /ORGANISM="Dinobryon sp., Strain UTEXLB2267" /LENGTH=201 /DNA_ID=CAMNT_0010286749 /DNA_START=8 /DNA_END=613 /DNA_ORIENTATION=+
MTEVLIPFIKSLVVLDAEGDRLFAKYYDNRVGNKAEQLANEQTLFKKTKTVAAKNEAEVLLLDSEIFVFRSGNECKFYISGPVEENELILVGVLDVIFDTVSTLLKGQVDKRTMLDNLELILLTIDEALDHGHIMELDSAAVVSRVLMKSSDASASGSSTGHSAQPQTIGDLSISQALGLAKDQFFKSLISGSSKAISGGN